MNWFIIFTWAMRALSVGVDKNCYHFGQDRRIGQLKKVAHRYKISQMMKCDCNWLKEHFQNSED
jgi:hypothetical protein